jgi:hypothetical protein
MDHVAFPLVVGGVAAVLATAVSLLPERLDVAHVFAAYGAGAIFGELVAARNPGVAPDDMMRRWGALVLGLACLFWVFGLLNEVL